MIHKPQLNPSLVKPQLSIEDELKKEGLLELALDAGIPLENTLQYFLNQIITADPETIEIKLKAEKLSRNRNINILIVGETGTGKELFARVIHGNSRGKFIGINTAGIPDGILESELFGSVEGAFTGAKHRIGLIEEAKDGTLFLDEIGDMPLLLQAKLLRALQEHEIRKVGSNHAIAFNCRIVAATNQDLTTNVNGFRRDLYYRLAGSVLKLKPLKQRGDDYVLIAKKLYPEINLDLLVEFRNKMWEGNIRELINCIEEYKTLNT